MARRRRNSLDPEHKYALGVLVIIVLGFLGSYLKEWGMEGVYITAIIVVGVIISIILIGGAILWASYRQDNGINGLNTEKNKAKADMIKADTQLKIAAKSGNQIIVECERE